MSLPYAQDGLSSRQLSFHLVAFLGDSLTHRLVACATDDDANEEVRAWHRDKDPGPGPGDNWGFWDGSQLLVIDGRARLKAETTWVAREEGRSEDFWLVDVYSSGESLLPR